MKILIRVLSVFFLLANSSSLLAYSCKEESFELDQLFERNDVVFVGVVKKKLFDFSLGKDKYVFKVKGVYKGEAGAELIVWTASKCRAYFSPGEEYVVFSNIGSRKIWTDLNRTWRIYDKRKELTREFFDLVEKNQTGTGPN